MSLKDKLVIDGSAIGDKYAQILYLFNHLKNDTAARI